MKHTIAVVGPGAIGTTVAAALYEAGHTPMLCGRTPREHLALRRDEGTVLVPGPVRIDPAKFDEKVDLVFLAVKATQIEAAAPWLAALCHPSSIVCVLENGVEQESMISPFVPACPVVPCVVWFPAEAQPDGSVRLRGEASLTLPDNPAAMWCKKRCAVLGARSTSPRTSRPQPGANSFRTRRRDSWS